MIHQELHLNGDSWPPPGQFVIIKADLNMGRKKWHCIWGEISMKLENVATVSHQHSNPRRQYICKLSRLMNMVDVCRK